jgi:Flp pilus assembly protein TadD
MPTEPTEEQSPTSHLPLPQTTLCSSDDTTGDQTIASCTQDIQSGTFSGHNLTAAYINRGNAFIAKGQYDLAIADYTQALHIDPNDASAYNNRGLAYHSKGQDDLAIADYTQALRINPNLEVARENLRRLTAH